MWACAHVCRCLKGPRGIKFSKSGLRLAMNHLTWDLGIKYGSFAKLLLTTGSFLQLQ